MVGETSHDIARYGPTRSGVNSLARVPDITARRLGAALATLAILGTTSCSGGDPAAPSAPARIAFSVARIDLASDREARISIVNLGEQAVGPVLLSAGPVRNGGDVGVPGSSVQVTPAEIATLNPGASAEVNLAVSLSGSLQPGDYDAVVEARVPEGPRTTLEVRFRIGAPGPSEDGGEVIVSASVTSVRQGDVTGFSAQVLGPDGAPLEGAFVRWAVLPAGAGYVTENGRFVGFAPGDVQVVAASGSAADTVTLTVTARSLTGGLTVLGRGTETERYTSDLWVQGDHAYLGTWSVRVGSGVGNALYTWNVARPAEPVRTATLTVDARTVNDVKLRPDGRLALITHEGSADGLNGVTLLSLDDPASPRPIARFTTGLQSGVHNAWLDGAYAYLAVDGAGPAAGLRILDLSNPANPTVAASFYGGSSFLHDVYVRDGLAFLSHWNAGLIILDVGNGIAGGSPVNPVEVSRVRTQGGETHNAWYWPEAGYVFVGEEDFSTPGVLHVVDVRDLAEPKEVATFRVPGTTPHNFWVDESRAILYAAWYGNGVRMLDVSGELLGELERQGREYLGLQYDGPGLACPHPTIRSTCTWAPQLHEGLLYVSDQNGGLRILQPRF